MYILYTCLIYVNYVYGIRLILHTLYMYICIRLMFHDVLYTDYFCKSVVCERIL